MLKVLVTGSNGQLGKEIQSLAAVHPDLEFTFTDVEELDITDTRALDTLFSANQFQVLINCAGYTAVDKAEDEPELAMKINGEAVQHLATACVKYHCYPIHISTDYVFCGSHSKPYTEEDIPDPASAYGKSKLMGERYFYDIVKKGLIIRTSWLYSAHGKNFVKTILGHGKNLNELKVVFDQVGSPTYARDLARHILQILPGAAATDKYGIYHYSNEGVSSWYDLALETLQIAGYDCKVLPIRSSEYPTKAPRPFYSLLDKSKIKNDFGISIPHWKDSLAKCIQAIGV